MATKKELQEKYTELYGEKPDDKVTVKQLKELIADKEQEKEPEPDQTVKSGEKGFVSDPSLLKRVESIKDTRQYRDDKGAIKGGRLYYGEKK